MPAHELAREAADAAARDGQPRFVAGSVGPTNRSASISPDVEDPGARNVDFAMLVDAYGDAMAALLEGGADFILLETIFDTLNAKAAIFAVRELRRATGHDIPMLVSGTITDASGRTLSGQTSEAFYHSVKHADPLAIGLNCALGAEQLQPYVRELAGIAEMPVSVHPNAGLPNAFGEYEQTPDTMAALVGAFAREGWVNLVGGCCGTTAEHIAAIVDATRGVQPRGRTAHRSTMTLTGLEPFTVDDTSLFVNVGERTNVTGSAKFARLIREDLLDEAGKRGASTS